MKLVESTPNQSPPTRRSFMNMRAILLISLTILVIASGMGIFWSMRAAQVSLMNGKMTATTQANGNITATVTAANPYGGVLVLDDPLHDNSLGHWYQGSDSVSSCKFVGGTYQASFSPGPRISANAGRFCTALNSADFSNFTFEVQMTIIKGDFGGIVFRVPQDASGGYEFAVGQDGLYILQRMENSDRRLLLGPTFSSAIHMGLGQLNIITVFAQGNLIRLYINNQKIASVTDNMYSHGSVSLLADTYISTTNFHSTMVAYNNAKLWILP